MKKQKITGILVLTLLVVLLASCKPEQLDDCFTSTGSLTTEERSPGFYNRISLNDNVNLVLVAGNQPKLKVEAGKNLLKAIKTIVSDSTLEIRNTMKCNWVRNYKKEITVYATAPALKEIRYESSGDVSTTGQLAVDSLEFNIWGGSGTIELDLNTENLKLALHYGTTDLHVKGKSIITTIFANSYGPFYCNELISNIVYIRNSGTNNCYVYARHILEVEITSVGSIYYAGDPFQLKSYISGSGKLIRME
ncbi:MAG TPA: head GIN domain-containing protein [Lentimicrobium sp.]|jgi:hypothetical protein|nr:head GIN domain-containing protein [Lentimicrobium sp.]